MRTFLTFFGGISMIAFLALGFFAIMLGIKGDQWLESAIKAEFQQRFSVEPQIESTELFLTDPGFQITGVSIPLAKPPMKIEMESLLVQLHLNPTNIFSEENVLDLEIKLEKPELRWGAE